MLGHISTYLVGVQREGCNKIIYNYIPCDIRTGARNCFFELANCHPVSHSHESRHRIRSGIYRWDLCWYPTLTWLVGIFVRPKEYLALLLALSFTWKYMGKQMSVKMDMCKRNVNIRACLPY